MSSRTPILKKYTFPSRASLKSVDPIVEDFYPDSLPTLDSDPGTRHPSSTLPPSIPSHPPRCLGSGVSGVGSREVESGRSPSGLGEEGLLPL